MNSITTMLVYGIIVGTIFIFLAMILNVVNGVKNKDLKRVFLDQNGIVGILLYTFILLCVGYYYIKGKMIVSLNTAIIVSLILVLIILFNDKIMNFIQKQKSKDLKK